MQATLIDAEGPRRWRIAPYAAPLAMLLTAIYGDVGDALLALVLGSFASFNVIGLAAARRGAPRSAELVCGPGYVDIRKAGLKNQRIRARDITGGTTARDERGVMLTLQLTSRSQPITLVVPSEAEADKVRAALGIGHGGFGNVAWRTQLTLAGFVGRLIAVGAVLLTTLIGLVFSWRVAAAFSPIVGMFGVVGCFLGIVGLLSRADEATVVMTATGLRLRTPRGWFALPYEMMNALVSRSRALIFSVPAPHGDVPVECTSSLAGGLSDAERQILTAQVRAASARARGLGPMKNDVTGRVDVLRRNGESARDWLVRLDMAAQMLSAGPGYRGHSLDVDDLWAILEDPDGEAELRAAAARVLRGTQPRVRIDSAIAAVRDERAHRLLRIAVDDDLDGATEELVSLDQAPAAAARSSSR